MSDLKVKLQVFEGPLDLLLHLVKVNEMDLNELPIAEITGQYLGYVRLMQSLDLELAGEYLVMASTLLNMKLRALLPDQGEPEEEDAEIGDIMTAQALMEKLIEYRKFKEAASELRDQEARQSEIFFRDVALPRLSDLGREDGIQLDLERLLSAMARVIRFIDRTDWHLVTDEEFSVEEKMDSIEGRLAAEKRVDVEDLFRACRSKVEMIVCLLAILELCHLRRAALEQSEAFGSIHLYEPSERPAPLAEDAGEELPSAPSAVIVDMEEPEGEAGAEDADGLPPNGAAPNP